MLLSARDTIAKTEEIEPTVIKKEPVLDEWSHGGGFGRVTSTIRTRTSHAKTGHEVIEILSDSDSEAELPVSKKGLTGSIMGTHGEKKGKGKEEGTETPKTQIGGGNKGKQYLPPFDPSEFTKESETIWTDSNAVSFVIEGAFQVTKELRVDRVEYLTDIPCVWPIPRIQTAFILDLRDDAKYLVRKETGKIVTPVTPDFLLKNKVRTSIFETG